MGTDLSEWVAHPLGEQPEVEEWSTVADTFAGRVHIEWDTAAPVTPLGQLPFFIEYEAGRPVRRLGGGLPAVVHQPERATQTRRAGHPVVIGAGGAPALCARHGIALRCGEPAAARHEQSGQRRCAAAGAGEDR